MKLSHEWRTRMRLLCLALPLMLATGCVGAIPEPDEPSVDPVCPGTRAARADLAAALADTPDEVIVTPWGERVVRAGALLVDLVDARCAE